MSSNINDHILNIIHHLEDIPQPTPHINNNDKRQKRMYIVFEGINNTGKTTQIQNIQKTLPTKTKTKIRIITEKQLNFNKHTPEQIKILKYTIQRYKKNIHKIQPQDTKQIIISDRSYYTNIAYYGTTPQNIQLIKNTNQQMPNPYLTFYFKTKNTTPQQKNIQERYEQTLPYNTITITKEDHNIKQTTKYITNQILKHYKKLTTKNTTQQKTNYKKTYNTQDKQ